MKKISNMTIILAVIAILGCIIIVKTSINYVQDHNQKLLYAMESKVAYNAKRCYLEGQCPEQFTLKDLYDKGYITEVINPVTKEIMASDTKLEIVEEEVQIHWAS